MKQFLLALFCVLAIKANGQDTTLHRTITQQSSLRVRLDTNKVVYDEQGKALHFYQYEKLLNTGDYTMRLSGSPLDPATKRYLKKMSTEEKNAQLADAKEHMVVKSPFLKEKMQLDVTPLAPYISTTKLKNKIIVLVFWSADCPPCTEDFSSLNDFLKQIPHPDELALLAITPDDKKKADDKLIDKPLLYANILSDAEPVMKAYRLIDFPTYIVADRNGIIRYATSGSRPLTLSSLKNMISVLLSQ